MVKKNKLFRGRWSQEEITLLKKLYPKGNPKKIADRLGRSPASIVQKAFRMGLRKKTKQWSKLSHKK